MSGWLCGYPHSPSAATVTSVKSASIVQSTNSVRSEQNQRT
jgi:hypothetical protein